MRKAGIFKTRNEKSGIYIEEGMCNYEKMYIQTKSYDIVQTPNFLQINANGQLDALFLEKLTKNGLQGNYHGVSLNGLRENCF